MAEDLRESALEYHRLPTPGKISVIATKPLGTQRDLALAYSPGVAAACEEIVRDPNEASTVTARGNLVAVITNGTAVLGLGAIGPLAAKPVMEGKGVLFKKFAGIDVFDIEVAENDPDEFVKIVASLEPTFGGINLEDIKAPECFEIERRLREKMKIPVFHDDQHDTAIIVGAAVSNALKLVGKEFGKVKLVCSGAGAAALACLDILVRLGVKAENITVCDIVGVVYEGRTEQMDPYKGRYARKTSARTLADAIKGADIFLGLSAPRVLKPEWVADMAEKPLVFALANPTPEIMPEEVKAVRPDAIVATGRSDYPNQVNNVLCFPYLFRGALDVGATTINSEMELAAVRAIAELAHAESDERTMSAYGGESLAFGPEYLIPKPFDPRLILNIAPAVAEAAMRSGVATRPIEEMTLYKQRLAQFVFRSGLVMKPVFERARKDPRRVVYGEGEERRVLRAVQTVVDEGLARPILVGRRAVVERRIEELKLRLKIGEHLELCDPEDDPRYYEYWTLYHQIMGRKGVSPDAAKEVVRTRNTVIAALMLKRREAEAMIAGVSGQFSAHLEHILDVIGLKPEVRQPAAMNLLILSAGSFFICDTHVTPDPDAGQIAEMTMMAVEEMQRFGIKPKVALLSHSNFGTHEGPPVAKMQKALEMIRARAPKLEIEGEMHADTAISEEIRKIIFPYSKLRGAANLLIMPNLDAANISFNLLKVLGEGLAVGPILMGVAQPAHVLTPSATVRRIVNMTALAVADAQMAKQG